MHVEKQACVVHTHSPSHLLSRGNQRQHSRTQIIKLSEEDGGDKQEMLQHKFVVGVFLFFHSKTVWKKRKEEKQHTHQRTSDLEDIFEIHPLPHFLSMLRSVSPVQLVTDTAFTCNYKCCSMCSSKKHILERFNWCKRSVQGSLRVENWSVDQFVVSWIRADKIRSVD